MKNQIIYTEHNGLYLPNLVLPRSNKLPPWQVRLPALDFMKKHRRGTYTTLLTEGRLNEISTRSTCRLAKCSIRVR